MEYPKIPMQLEGKKHDTASMRCLNSLSEAENFYQILVRRLMEVNNWHQLMKNSGASFILCDENGKKIDRYPAINDYIKIDISGPGNIIGKGYDWVQVIEIQQNDSEFPFSAITVSPISNPTTSKGDTAHFFESKASSTFMVRRIGTCVIAEIHGRNEENNTSSGSFLDRVRNTIIAIGAKVGIGKVQWKFLTQALVQKI